MDRLFSTNSESLKKDIFRRKVPQLYITFKYKLVILNESNIEVNIHYRNDNKTIAFNAAVDSKLKLYFNTIKFNKC